MLTTSIAGIELSSCIMNASGVNCTTQSDLQELLNTNIGAIVTKSCTLQKRIGNPEPRYADIPFGSINSMGLPNNGIKYYIDFIEENIAKTNKLIILSIAGLSFNENVELLKIANASKQIKILELNLSCPNIAGKPQTGYDFDVTEQLLDKAFETYQYPLAVKLPPYFDMAHFEKIAEILNRYPLAYVCGVNSIGNGMWVNVTSETTLIKPKYGFGGIGGMYIKPTALANVRMFYKLLNNMDVVGCGGVQTGQDVFEHILCGASLVQIGTTLWQQGTSCFDRITNELILLMKKKGYKSINDFKGKLKEL